MDGPSVYKGLLDRGYEPVQAAALTGNILQESGGNPDALNAKEGANGLLQWRLDRLQGLQDFAKARGTTPNDPDTQLDFIGQEMKGPESRHSSAFFGAPDLESANAALKSYIRYGDNSQGTRLANAQGILKDSGATAPMAMAGPQASPQSAPAAPAQSVQPSPQAPQPGPAAPPQFDMAALSAVPQLQNILQPRPNYLGRSAPFSLRG